MNPVALIAALRYVRAKVDAAINAIEREAFEEAEEAMRDAEARLRVASSDEGGDR